MLQTKIEWEIRRGVDKALNWPIMDGKSVIEWAAVGMKAPRWIPVWEQLPRELNETRYPDEAGNEVTFTHSDDLLMFIPGRGIVLGRREMGNWVDSYGWFLNDDVTHWMELPEAPEEDENG